MKEVTRADKRLTAHPEPRKEVALVAQYTRWKKVQIPLCLYSTKYKKTKNITREKKIFLFYIEPHQERQHQKKKNKKKKNRRNRTKFMERDNEIGKIERERIYGSTVFELFGATRFTRWTKI